MKQTAGLWESTHSWLTDYQGELGAVGAIAGVASLIWAIYTYFSNRDLSKPSRLPVWTIAIGLPIVFALYFNGWVRQHPWATLVLLVVYELCFLIFSFALKIVLHLYEQVTDRWAARVQEYFSNYRKRYLQHLIYRHRNFDVKGLSTQGTYTLKLEQVFVDLSMVPTTAHQASADPVPALTEPLRTGRHSIWDYLKGGDRATQNLAIIGAPGCGKTTLVKHMALTLAIPKRRRKRATALKKLPVLLFLRNHAKTIAGNINVTLAQIIQDSLANLGPTPKPDWFAKRLTEGHCLVMLDGLDEVADPQTRQQVVQWVENQMIAHGSNDFIITSRPHGYRDNPLSHVTVLEVRPFTSRQVKRFIHNWYLANEIMSCQENDPGVYMEAREGAEDLLKRLRNTPALGELSVNPLLLTMIATVHRYRSELPGRRVELYAEICEVFLGKRQQARGLAIDLTPAQKQRVLEPLAYHMLCQQQREIATAEACATIPETLARVSPQTSSKTFLKMIENTSGLLLERENGVYSFSHLTFQEYLAASHIQRQRLEEELIAQVGNSWWHETLRLYAAQADATPIIEACIADNPPVVSALMLAIECLEEAREIQPQVRDRLETMLTQGVEDTDSKRREIIAEALLALRLRRMTRVNEDQYVDASLITHAEYQLFLNERRAAREYHQPDHWSDYQFPSSQGRSPVTGIRPADAASFCEWLTHREEGEWNYRLPNIDEFKAYPVQDNTGTQSTASIGYWVHSYHSSGYTIAGITDAEIDSLYSIPEYIRNFDLSRDLASDLACDLDLDLDLARDLDRARARARALARALASDLARDLARAHALDLASNLASARDLNLASNLARDLNLAIQLICKRDYEGTLTSICKPNDWKAVSSYLCGYICFYALILAGQFISLQYSLTPQSSWTDRLRKDPQKEDLKIWTQHFVNVYCDIYVSFTILRERIQGNLPAFEGIRIVKERRQETEEGN